jgi:hypothetical protein
LNQFLDRLRELISQGHILISDHGYDELSEDGITAGEVIEGIHDAVVIEEYPDYMKGPCILVLQKDRGSKPIHVVWGIPRGYNKPAVLVTAYRPNTERWDENFMKRL